METKAGAAVALLLGSALLLHCGPSGSSEGEQGGARRSAQDEVSFLSKNPVIDGHLDLELAHLEIRTFSEFWQFDNPATERVSVTYRLAYTASHLYLYIETAADAIDYHRRGYLWGDGYKLLLAIPQQVAGQSPAQTDEYYDLLFSPSRAEDGRAEQSIGSFNFGRRHRQLSSATRSQEQALDGKCGFEALIAWSDIPPYHPWFLDAIGYNIYFAKAVESWTNGYAVVADEGIWDEELAKRSYAPLAFAAPSSVSEQVILARPRSLALAPGSAIALETVTIGKEQSVEKLELSLRDLDGQEVASREVSVPVEQSLSRQALDWSIDELPPGRYLLTASGASYGRQNFELVVLPSIDAKSLHAGLQEESALQDVGVRNTLTFKLRQIERQLAELRPYEDGGGILDDWREFREENQLFTSGADPYQDREQPYRRAFRSEHDGSYQPYSLKLPAGYDPDERYPLLVFLHGSGQNDERLLDRARSNGRFIEIAPLARDIFRAYAGEDSQRDIVEAIDDVIAHFSVDSGKIIIGGFSMGGYGALRAYYEHPERYAGVAVFAGHPNLASEWLDEEHPNFLDARYLAAFAGTPVFIYHGRDDAALPVGLMEEAAQRLRAAGASVTQSIVEGRGHEYPDEASNAMYFEWLVRAVH